MSCSLFHIHFSAFKTGVLAHLRLPAMDRQAETKWNWEVEYAVLGVMMFLNLGLGLYFSMRKKTRSTNTTAEVFLGSRALRAVPLAASVVASLFSSTGLVGLTGHFYAYGFHQTWLCVTTIAVAPLAGHLFLPVLYGLRITSVFEYIRMRFNSAISLTACASYIFLTQSIGALSIFAASLTMVTVFGFPLLWCNIVIGVCGTLYTALGGLRGVVWTDCMQLVFILLGPIAVMVKIIVNSVGAGSTIQPLKDFSVVPYIANFHIDLTHDENVWSVLFASTTATIYRVCLDQVVVQRCMASKTLKNAQRTLVIGSFLLAAVYIVSIGMSIALVIWFRGCDPELAGAIRSNDQILPFYVKHNLVEYTGFTGIFLAAVVSASTSTISSVINSQAAVLYVDVLSQHCKIPDSRVGWTTRGLAFATGAIMTMYSCVCVYMGSIIRVILMVSAVATGPFVGLLLLAVAFPFVHSKGAGISTLLMLFLQFIVMWQAIQNGATPPRMPVTLEYCPVNGTYFSQDQNYTMGFSHNSSNSGASNFQLSPFWSCLFSTIGTVVIGVVISVLAGEHRQPTAESKHVNIWFPRMWRKLGIMKHIQNAENEETKNETPGEVLLQRRDGPQAETVA